MAPEYLRGLARPASMHVDCLCEGQPRPAVEQFGILQLQVKVALDFEVSDDADEVREVVTRDFVL
jgi:hypothetical protein